MATSFAMPTEYSAEQDEIARRRKYAELLQAQSIEPLAAPPTPAGGFAVPISPMAGLAKMLQAYTGAKGQADATAQQRELGQKYKREQADILGRAFAAGSGTPASSEMRMDETAAGGDGQMAQFNAPAVAPDPQRMAMLLQQSDNPAHQAFGMQTLQQEMQRKRLAALLGGGEQATPQQPQGGAVGAPVAPVGGAQPVAAAPVRTPTGGVPAGIDPMAWRLAVDKGDQGALSKMIQDAYSDANKPTDLQRNLGFVGIAKDSPEARTLVTDPSARLGAQNATLVEFTIPGTDRKIKVPNNIANILATGVAPDEKTARIAMSVASKNGMPMTIGIGEPAGMTGSSQIPLGEAEKAGMHEAATGSVKHVATDLNESLAGAQNALQRHVTLQQMHTALASGKAITGPGATPATWFQRVGEAAFGPGNKKSVVETQQLVQGLADLALSGASAMKGQGQITENERLLLMKAKSGVQNLVPDELNALLTIFDKQNRSEIAKHNDRYTRAEKIKYPNLDYWGKVAEPPKLGTPSVGVSLTPEAIKFMQDNNIPVPGR